MHSRFFYQLSAVVAAISLFAISAQAQLSTFQAVLSGPAESPPNVSPGTGFTTVTIDPTTHMLHVVVNFSGLVGTTSAAHIHAPTANPFSGAAGVATQTPSFGGFPLGVTSGTYDNTFNMSLASTWNPSYVSANGGTASGAENAFIQAMVTGRTYLNIHTSSFGGGEIRGFLSAAPETGTTLTLMILALGGLAIAASRVRRA